MVITADIGATKTVLAQARNDAGTIPLERVERFEGRQYDRSNRWCSNIWMRPDCRAFPAYTLAPPAWPPTIDVRSPIWTGSSTARLWPNASVFTSHGHE